MTMAALPAHYAAERARAATGGNADRAYGLDTGWEPGQTGHGPGGVDLRTGRPNVMTPGRRGD